VGVDVGVVPEGEEVACAAEIEGEYGDDAAGDAEDRRALRCEVSGEAAAAVGEAATVGVVGLVPSSTEVVRSREFMRNERGLGLGLEVRKDAFLVSGGAGKFFLRSTCG